MPYIKSEHREEKDVHIDNLLNRVYACGDMNYVITKLIHGWLIDRHFCYKAINEMVGVLECAKLELYRMIAAPYEDKKKRENGAVSELDKGD